MKGAACDTDYVEGTPGPRDLSETGSLHFVTAPVGSTGAGGSLQSKREHVLMWARRCMTVGHREPNESETLVGR